MPTSSPPPPPPIEHVLSLDERLVAAGEQVQVPGRPGITVSASLTHVPSRMNILFGTDDRGVPVLELEFDFLETITERKKHGAVQASAGPYAVMMDVGEQTGRLYRLSMTGIDLSQESVTVVTQGIRACFEDYVQHHQESLRQQAILRSTATLVAKLLPVLVEELRESPETAK